MQIRHKISKVHDKKKLELEMVVYLFSNIFKDPTALSHNSSTYAFLNKIKFYSLPHPNSLSTHWLKATIFSQHPQPLHKLAHLTGMTKFKHSTQLVLYFLAPIAKHLKKNERLPNTSSHINAHYNLSHNQYAH